MPKWLFCPSVATWMSSQAAEPLELQVWTEMRFCRTCWQGALVVGRHPGGARCTGGSLPCGLWWVHEKKEVMSPERLRYFSRLTESSGFLWKTTTRTFSVRGCKSVCNSQVPSNSRLFYGYLMWNRWSDSNHPAFLFLCPIVSTVHRCKGGQSKHPRKSLMTRAAKSEVGGHKVTEPLNSSELIQVGIKGVILYYSCIQDIDHLHCRQLPGSKQSKLFVAVDGSLFFTLQTNHPMVPVEYSVLLWWRQNVNSVVKRTL